MPQLKKCLALLTKQTHTNVMTGRQAYTVESLTFVGEGAIFIDCINVAGS